MTTVCDIQTVPANLGSCGTLFRDRSGVAGSRSYRILRPVFAELWSVFDQYIVQANDIPWWYTERSLVGLLTAAAFRAGYSAIEEFGCARRDNEPKGRVDWWIGGGPRNRQLLVETKQAELSSDGTWATVSSLFKEARIQVLNYDLGPDYASVPRVLIVFVRPYFKRERNWSEQRELWLADMPGETDYCAYYWLEQEHQNRCVTDGGYCYPGILACCQEAGIVATEN